MMGPMIAAAPDLLVIGGLTIDRFADGSSAAGGSVLHIARAAGPRAVRVSVVTAAGPEPEARAGIDELDPVTASVDWGDATATFVHRDSPGERSLWRAAAGGPISMARVDVRDPRAILAAPIADEMTAADLHRLGAASTRGAILQGFLRSFAADGEVRPLPLSALAPQLVAELRAFDLLVASREDLRGEATEPSDQLTALRRIFGPRPELVVTDGVAGAWMEREHLPVPRRVDGVSSVGAGDVFAAFMLAGGWPMPAPAGFARQRAVDAMRVVAEVLEERRA
jgi:sugar/nucleoside kinase (ribokinase family)